MLRNRARPILYVQTTKMKRYKFLAIIFKILLSPFYLLSYSLYYLSSFSESMHNWLENGADAILIKIVHMFNWNETALNQLKVKPKRVRVK